MSEAPEIDPDGIGEKTTDPPSQGDGPNVHLSEASQGGDINDGASIVSNSSDLFFPPAEIHPEEDNIQPFTDQPGNANLVSHTELEHDQETDQQADEGHGRVKNPEHQQQDESDNDCCLIIDRNEIPDEVKTKFDAFQFSPQPTSDVICTGFRPVKVEEEDDELWDPPEDPNRDSGSEFDGDEYAPLSDGEDSGNQRRRRRELPRTIRQTSAQGVPQIIVKGGSRETLQEVHNHPPQDSLQESLSQTYHPTQLTEALNEGNSDEHQLDELLLTTKDDLEIAMINRRKLERSKEAGKLDGPGHAQLEQLNAEISQMQSKVSEMEKNKKENEYARRRKAPAPDAREYWRRRYGKGQQFPRRRSKFNNLKRPGDPSVTSEIKRDARKILSRTTTKTRSYLTC